MTPTPPRGKLFSSDGAAALYEAFKKMPHAVQYAFVDRAAKDLYATTAAFQSANLQEQKAIRSLREAFEVNGESPSSMEFPRLGGQGLIRRLALQVRPGG